MDSYSMVPTLPRSFSSPSRGHNSMMAVVDGRYEVSAGGGEV